LKSSSGIWNFQFVPPFNRKVPLNRNHASIEKLLAALGICRRKSVIIRRLIVPLSFAAVALHAGQALAQDTFPAPLPGQAGAPASSASPVPPVNGAAPSAFIGGPFPSSGASDGCMKGFAPLREEAEKRGKMIKAASERHAPPDEACKLIGNYSQAELKLIKFAETNAAACGIPPRITDQLKTGHKNTETMQRKVCAVAQQAKSREPAGPVGDFWPASGPAGDFGSPADPRN
jgi:hypothetical protein